MVIPQPQPSALPLPEAQAFSYAALNKLMANKNPYGMTLQGRAKMLMSMGMTNDKQQAMLFAQNMMAYNPALEQLNKENTKLKNQSSGSSNLEADFDQIIGIFSKEMVSLKRVRTDENQSCGSCCCSE